MMYQLMRLPQEHGEGSDAGKEQHGAANRNDLGDKT